MIRHIACIMDGNRRWAKKQGVRLAKGCGQGMQKISMVVDFCLAQQIPNLSLYSFSIENFNRSEYEKECYFNLLLDHGKEQADAMAQKSVRVRFVGNRSLFPQHVKNIIQFIEDATKPGNSLTLNLLFCYGGRHEIIAAIARIIEEVRMGKEISLDEELLKNYLWMGNSPDPEIIIRTGFSQRLSNFLLYQAAYSELYFAQCLWPDITENHLNEAVQYYKECKRNFGK